MFLSPDANGSYIYFDNDPVNKPYGTRSIPHTRDASDSLVFYDLTDWLIREMRENASGSIANRIKSELRLSLVDLRLRAVAWVDFADVVQTHGLWDFKWEIDEKLGGSIRLAGTWYRNDVPGNIHYAYVGRAIGFTEGELICGGALAAIIRYRERASMLCNADHPEDREAIEAGFDLWRQGGTLTQATLKSVLNRHPGIAKADAIPQQAYPKRSLSVVLAWPFPVGYFDDGSAGWFTRSR